MAKPLIAIETTINADAKSVWDCMTRNPAVLFLGAKVETDWAVGGPIRFSGSFKGKSFEDHGEICAVEPCRELSFTHVSGEADPGGAGNLVRYALEPKGRTTRVTLTQTPLGPAAVTPDQRAAMKATWAQMLQGLKKAAEDHCADMTAK
jgi:uncharacterized protein YndB with AHSA1/START domain